MQRFFHFFFAAFLLMALCSCSTYIYLNKIKDPEIPVKKPDSIVFVNLYDYLSTDIVKEKNEIAFQSGVKGISEGLAASFAARNDFRFIVGDTLKRGIRKDQMTAYLPKDTIIAACKKWNTGMLLTVDSIHLGFYWETEGDENLKTKNFYLDEKFYISLYYLNGDLVNRSLVSQRSFYKSRDALSGLITFKPSLAKAEKALRDIAFNAGDDYVQKFYSHKIQEPRQLYGGKVFAESNKFIELRNWEKAIELLEPITLSSDIDIAAKAKHNLTVVKEASLQ